MRTINKIQILKIPFLILFFFFVHNLMSQSFNDIFSPNGGILWVVGNNGIIYRSPDGGNTFSNRSQGSVNYNCVTGKSNTLWIAGDNGAILKSTNAGVNFLQLPLGTNDNITSLYFADVNTGWVACSNGRIYKSTDGGSTWSQQNSQTSVYLSVIKFADALSGFASGNNGTVIVTTNGGSNWNSSSTPSGSDILASDINGSVIIAGMRDAKVIKTTNLGINWSLIDYKITTKSDITGISMLSQAKYFSCGVGGFIRLSTDGGNTFTFQNNPLMIDLKKLYFYDSTKGWALSSTSSIVIRTTNGGQQWLAPAGTVQTLGWTLKIPLSFYTSSGNVFYQSPWNKKEIFVTNSNRVYRSMDMGETWQPIGNTTHYGMVSNSFFVSPKDTNIFLMAIDSNDNVTGKVLRSTNYGQSWTETFSGNRISDGIPMEIDPNHPDTVYYAPTDSMLYRSTNFGLTWISVNPLKFENVCTIEVLEGNSNIIFVSSAEFSASGSSKIRRTTNWGVTWTLVDSNSGPYPEVPDISTTYLDSAIYATQYRSVNGGVKRSLDKGQTWINVNIDQSAWGFDIAKDDPNVFVYAPWDYNVTTPAYITYNKGVHFTPLQNFAVYFYNRNTLFLQQVLGFYKLSVNITTPIGIQPISNIIPVKFSLEQNYPNPFNPVTGIEFNLPKQGSVKLEVFDVLGQTVSVLVNDMLREGEYKIQWDASAYPSGVYFYRLQTDDFSETKKMMLVK